MEESEHYQTIKALPNFTGWQPANSGIISYALQVNGPKNRKQYECSLPDSIVVRIFNQFVGSDSTISFKDIFLGQSGPDSNRDREMLPAALLAMCLRSYNNQFYWPVGLVREQGNPVDFLIGKIAINPPHTSGCLYFQQKIFPNYFHKLPAKKRVSRAIDIVTQALEKPVDKSAISGDVLHILFFSQIFVTRAERDLIYNAALPTIKEQTIYKEYWFLYPEIPVNSGCPISAEKIRTDGKAWFTRIDVMDELNKYAKKQK
jgi:hypothetical protein